MSKRDEILPFGRHKPDRWTRPSDYVAEADLRLIVAPQPDLPDKRKRISRRGLWLPIAGLGIAAAALWTGGAFDRAGQAEPSTPAAATASATSSDGLVFGLCDQGGGTNCVVDGDSFYMDGKGIRIAGIDAPSTHSAHCDAEALLGWAAAERLHAALNSGTVTLEPVAPGTDPNGRLLRTVKVDGREIGPVLVAAGLAKPSAETPAEWC